MLVLVSGASGLVGTALEKALLARGDRVRRLVRRAPREGEVRWDPSTRTLDPRALDGVDAVVNLAGENIGAKRWNEAHKAKVLGSRVDATATIVAAIAAASSKPRVLVNASAVGYYGPRGTERIDETAPRGTGFLADVCAAWEAEAMPAEAMGVRVVLARLGVVLAREGGALEKMKLPFSLGLGGRLGEGAQGFAWVALDDVVGAMLHAIDRDAVRGPINVTAPVPVSNAELTKALGRALRRPTPFPVPAIAMRIAAGREMAEELLLGGSFVLPRKLEASGYRFRFSEIGEALEVMVGA